MKMNVPNQLTIVRIILTPIFLALFLADIPHHFLIGLIVFAVGAITDFLDGKIARKNNIVTVFGQLADPVADKILTTAALLAFMQFGLVFLVKSHKNVQIGGFVFAFCIDKSIKA